MAMLMSRQPKGWSGLFGVFFLLLQSTSYGVPPYSVHARKSSRLLEIRITVLLCRLLQLHFCYAHGCRCACMHAYMRESGRVLRTEQGHVDVSVMTTVLYRVPDGRGLEVVHDA